MPTSPGSPLVPELDDAEADRALVRVLTICSHNRTRSVMMATMIEAMLSQRLDEHTVRVTSAGYGPEGMPPIADAVEAMERRGHDVSAHRSQHVTTELLKMHPVALAAERDHVVGVAAMSPQSFKMALTLPEFLGLGVRTPPNGGEGVREWVSGLTADRTAGSYLRADIGEIDDPTGSPPKAFEAAVVELERQCLEAVELLVRAVE